MTTRDPRIDPQPGDEVRGVDDKVRRVIWREGKMLMCESENMRYRMRVGSWQARCRLSSNNESHDPRIDPKPGDVFRAGGRKASHLTIVIPESA
jgi:hypothetical protein